MSKEDCREVVTVLDLGRTLSGMRGWSSATEVWERYNKLAAHKLSESAIRRRLNCFVNDAVCEKRLARSMNRHEVPSKVVYKWIDWPLPDVAT